MSDDIRTEQERKDAERDALIAGLSTELSRVYEKLDGCEEKLLTMAAALHKLSRNQRRLRRAIVGHPKPPPDLGNGANDD